MTELRDTEKEIVTMARRLKLTYLRDNVVELMETASSTKMTPRETLEYILRKEVIQRDSKRIATAHIKAHFPFEATMEGFDMSVQPSLDPGTIRELQKLEWIQQGENVVFLGPSGVGKTHLSIALGQLALEHGYSVKFYNTLRLVEQLERMYQMKELDQGIKEINKYKIIILDELGFLPMEPAQGQILLRLISSRYEKKKSIIVTSNKTPAEWGVCFGDAAAATAALDRLLHHCTPVSIMGDSYRTKECMLKKINKDSCISIQGNQG